MNLKTSSELETRSLLDEVYSIDERKGLFELGHPFVNRIAETFVKAAGIGAVQAVSREAYLTAIDGNSRIDGTTIPPPPDAKKNRLPVGLRGSYTYTTHYLISFT